MTALPRRRSLWIGGFAVVAGAGVLTVLLARDAVPGDVMLDTSSVDLSPLDRVPAATWEALAAKRVAFGHQSVGYDILAGIGEIARTRPAIRLRAVETDAPSEVAGPALVHFRVGRNTDARSKIDDFVRRVESAGEGAFDVALLKLCYVDVDASTPVSELFAAYRDAFERLERRFPRTTFVRATVPLTAQKGGVKPRLQRLAGRTPGHDADNRARAAFNALVRAEFTGKRPLFDVAAAESSLPDGTRTEFRIGPDSIPCLARCYTTDGGHLNDAGRLAVARDALLALVEAVR